MHRREWSVPKRKCPPEVQLMVGAYLGEPLEPSLGGLADNFYEMIERAGIVPKNVRNFGEKISISMKMHLKRSHRGGDLPLR